MSTFKKIIFLSFSILFIYYLYYHSYDYHHFHFYFYHKGYLMTHFKGTPLAADLKEERSRYKIKIGVPNYWGSLVPPLQHTAVGHAIIINSFEPLTSIGENGTITPSLAKSWNISNDFRVFTFKLDTTKRFSNGEHLTAYHLKAAWEKGLKMIPHSHNQSPLDALYGLNGFEDFNNSGKLRGVKILDAETIQLEYKRPFRMGLNYLSGASYAAFIYDSKVNKYYGTGRYILKEDQLRSKVLLDINPYHQESKSITSAEISVVAPENAKIALENNSIDLYDFAENSLIVNECEKPHKFIKCQIGQEGSHYVVFVNGLKGRFFNNQNYRLALQALIAKNLQSQRSLYPRLAHLEVDFQTYLPFQKGRLSENEVQEIISAGEKYIDEFKNATQKTPLFLVTDQTNDWIIEFLKNLGIKFSPQTGVYEWYQATKMLYKTSDMDLLLKRFSIADGDPDGIYHALGKNGSILCPMNYREKVAEKLEVGRTITNEEAIDVHYKDVSKTILEEVPYIHLGFYSAISAYRADQITFDSHIKKRTDNGYHIYQPL